MKTQLEDVSPVKKKLKVEVPADVVNQARALAIKDLQKNAKIEGFRAGKVPPEILTKKFGNEIQHETVEKIVDVTLAQAVRDTNIRPVSRPEIQPGIWSATGGFSYTATFEVLPEIQIKDYKGLKLEKTEVQVEEKEIDEELKRLQLAMTQLEPTPTETAFAEGHVATIDFQGTVGGESFKGGESKDYLVELGTGGMLADFEKGIKGAKAGEDRKIQFTYPQDYFNKELAGKEAHFNVKLKEIRKKNVPTLDDEFAKDLGDYKNLKEVRKDVGKRILAAKESGQKGELFSQILKQLVDKNKFDVPEALIRAELTHMLEEFGQEVTRRGQKVEDVNAEEVVKEFQPEAEFRVRSFLLLDNVANNVAMTVTEEEVENRLTAIAKGLNKPMAEIKTYYEKNNLNGSLKIRILHEKALEFVLKEAKIKVVKAKKGEK